MSSHSHTLTHTLAGLHRVCVRAALLRLRSRDPVCAEENAALGLTRMHTRIHTLQTFSDDGHCCVSGKEIVTWMDVDGDVFGIFTSFAL